MVYWSTNELAAARCAVASLLDALDLEGYLYELEPADDHWDIKVECARAGQWAVVTLAVERGQLLESPRNEAIRGALLDQWHQALGLSPQN